MKSLRLHTGFPHQCYTNVVNKPTVTSSKTVEDMHLFAQLN